MKFSVMLQYAMRQLVLGVTVSLASLTFGNSATTPSLELKLKVDLQPGTTNSVACEARLINTGDQATTLVVEQHTDAPGYQYKDAFLSMIGLQTEPVTHIHTAQTMDWNAPKVSHRLEPKEELAVDWKGQCGCLKPDDKYQVPTAPCLFEPGLYKITAQYTVATDTGHLMALKSNPVLLPYGNSKAPPKLTVVDIVAVDNAQKLATLEAGQNAGLSVGQEFFGRTGIVSGWRLTITEIDDHQSTATMTPFVTSSSAPPDLQKVTDLEARHTAVRWDTYFRRDACSPTWLRVPPEN